MTLRLIQSHDKDLLVPLLREAEEGDLRIIQTIEDSTSVSYVAQDDDTIVGAVVMRWETHESEIIYIATVPSVRGQGYGKAIMQALIEEARQRQVYAIFVGTSNASWNNIAFYQKCGFRMDSVKKDFFSYIPVPVYEDGIRMQDMLMLRLDLINA